MTIQDFLTKYGTHTASGTIEMAIHTVRSAGHENMVKALQKIATDLESALTDMATCATEAGYDRYAQGGN